VTGPADRSVTASADRSVSGPSTSVTRRRREQHRPGRHPPAGLHQRLPASVRSTVEQQHLHGPAGGLDQAQPGGTDAGVVDDEEIAGTEQLGQVGNPPMRRRPAGPFVDQQPGRVPWFDGGLGDGPLRQRVVEVGDVHRQRASPTARPPVRSNAGPTTTHRARTAARPTSQRQHRDPTTSSQSPTRPEPPPVQPHSDNPRRRDNIVALRLDRSTTSVSRGAERALPEREVVARCDSSRTEGRRLAAVGLEGEREDRSA
jgi:hypothetical protein